MTPEEEALARAERARQLAARGVVERRPEPVIEPGNARQRLHGAYFDAANQAIWHWLNDRWTPYPLDVFVPPLRPSACPRPPRRFSGADLDVPDAERAPGAGWGALRVDRATGPVTVQLSGERAIDAELVGTALFRHQDRSALVCFADGGRGALHQILRWWREKWVALGYRLDAIGSGTALSCLKVSRRGSVWYLSDLAGVVGAPAEKLDATMAALGETAPGDRSATAVRRAAEGFQRVMLGAFGVGASMSAGAAAVNALTRYVPDDRWVWRPSPGLAAMCWEGGGFRGGHVEALPYRGPAHEIDLHRAYASALREPLPAGATEGWCRHPETGEERPGIYLCRVIGPGRRGVYLSIWEGEGFRKQVWNGAHPDGCQAILTSSELPGLRALGYTVEPGYGFGWRRTLDLSPFVDRVQSLLDEHGPDSAVGLVVKMLVNVIYGKLAEKPLRDALVIAEERPSDWHTRFFVKQWVGSPDGPEVEVDHLWVAKTARYRRHQHVDWAAAITGSVRAKVYTALEALGAAGIGVLGVDTDGITTLQDPRGVALDWGDRIGNWRYKGYWPQATIAGPRFWTNGQRTVTAGTSRQPPHVVEAAFDRGAVLVGGKVIRPFYEDGTLYRVELRRLARAAAAAHARDGPAGAPHG